MLNKDKKYILAISGGADSVFLFHYLIENGIKNFVACHVNYNFRKDSNKDAELVTELCEKNNIELKILNIEQNYSQLKDNFESWARKVRYDFFCEELINQKADAILIAHNLNDHVETYLMQKKNKKTVSYYGIKKETTYKEKKIIRPILEFKKSEIVNSLMTKKIDFITDSTNADLKYERNKIRANLNESDFEKYLDEIFQNNSVLQKYEKQFEIIKDQSFLNLNNISSDEKWNEYLVFNFLKTKGLEKEIFFSKKSILKEIIKQLKTSKSFIEIYKGDFVIIKDYEKMYAINKREYVFFEINIEEKKKYESILKDNNIDFDGNLLITNDWKKYQSKISINGITLSKYYKDKKVSYIKRQQNILIFDKSKKILLNKITI
ncbi:tRNA lysidine(34) synthetase TilS [Spiroplasma sp. BIUS-1]|uniref:tRNA lysidine(34) synthetase TilS n=1 Tax=Spiroplasma sp. BIUS-1 TaxID=216964 RepID=UPI0013A6F25A|nr:tRNA lysidine(34) synthetase TilS [Spiroplasma sp. BIUS-1]